MSLSVLLVSIVSIAIIALVCGLIAHKITRNYWRANIHTVVYTLIIFHGVSYLEAGSIDPNWPISSVIISAVSVVVAIMIGKYQQIKRGA